MFEELEPELGSLPREHVNSYEKLDIVLCVRGRSEPVHCARSHAHCAWLSRRSTTPWLRSARADYSSAMPESSCANQRAKACALV
jgi:hypothetical protein